jgi:hypothetical protein
MKGVTVVAADAIPSARAERPSGSAVCQTRSRRRSERRPTNGAYRKRHGRYSAIGAEVEYFRAYRSFGLKAFKGHALYVGPTLHSDHQQDDVCRGLFDAGRFRGAERLGWAFTFAAVAYNLVRLPKLLASPS